MSVRAAVDASSRNRRTRILRLLPALFVMLIVFGILKATNLLRVSRQEEIEGLDIHEHGMPCYAADSAY